MMGKIPIGKSLLIEIKLLGVLLFKENTRIVDIFRIVGERKFIKTCFVLFRHDPFGRVHPGPDDQAAVGPRGRRLLLGRELSARRPAQAGPDSRFGIAQETEQRTENSRSATVLYNNS